MSDVFDRADRNGGVVKSGRVVCRVVSVEAATSLDHVTLIARLLTRLRETKIDIIPPSAVHSITLFGCLFATNGVLWVSDL